MSKTVAIVQALVAAAALAATGVCYEAYQALQAAKAQLISNTLEPMAALVRENTQLLDELQAAPFAEKDSGILESYLLKIRRDGVAKNADMKQRLDTLAENGTALTTLIAVYLPNAKTAAFKSEAGKYKNYAAAWRDRWNSVMELFMAGGNFPAAGPAFPPGFAAAVQSESAAAR